MLVGPGIVLGSTIYGLKDETGLQRQEGAEMRRVKTYSTSRRQRPHETPL